MWCDQVNVPVSSRNISRYGQYWTFVMVMSLNCTQMSLALVLGNIMISLHTSRVTVFDYWQWRRARWPLNDRPVYQCLCRSLLNCHILRYFRCIEPSWRWTELFPVLLYLRRRHAVTTTTAFVRLWSLARTDHSSRHSRQSHIYSFRRRGMERPAGSRHSCAVTRGL